MTDDEIIKGLDCTIYPYVNETEVTISSVKTLILNQKAEIERLRGCVKSEDEVRKIMKDSLSDMVRGMVSEQIVQAHEVGKNEGYIGFAEMVKKNRNRLFNTIYSDYYFCNMIDSFVIEMVEKKAEGK